MARNIPCPIKTKLSPELLEQIETQYKVGSKPSEIVSWLKGQGITGLTASQVSDYFCNKKKRGSKEEEPVINEEEDETSECSKVCLKSSIKTSYKNLTAEELEELLLQEALEDLADLRSLARATESIKVYSEVNKVRHTVAAVLLPAKRQREEKLKAERAKQEADRLQMLMDIERTKADTVISAVEAMQKHMLTVEQVLAVYMQAYPNGNVDMEALILEAAESISKR